MNRVPFVRPVDGPRIDLEGSGRVKYRPDRGERPRGSEINSDQY